jgi:acetyl-CoA acetyltransferase
VDSPSLWTRGKSRDPAEVEEVQLGCANQVGEDNRDVARMAVLRAGFPVQVAGGHLQSAVRFGVAGRQRGLSRHQGLATLCVGVGQGEATIVDWLG